MTGLLSFRSMTFSAACIILAACSGAAIAPSAGSAPAASHATPPATVSVYVQDDTYVPTAIRVKKGTTIVFTDRDHVEHTVTAVNHSFGSPILNFAKSWKHTFGKTGKVEYYCRIHPYMHGEVVVTN